MKIEIKTFEQLSKQELYEILRLRSEVFIVEQGGRYQDLDGIDYYSVHIFCRDDAGKLLGCIRIFEKEGEPGTVQLGRLVTRVRGSGIGRRLIEEAAREAKKRFGASGLYLTGRKDALGFYEKCGFSIREDEKMLETVPYRKLRRMI